MTGDFVEGMRMDLKALRLERDQARAERDARHAQASAAESALAEVLEEMQQTVDWLSTERFRLGAVDGYDYHSGEEYGLRRAEIKLAALLAKHRSHQ